MSTMRVRRPWPIALAVLTLVIAMGAVLAIPATPSSGQSGETGDRGNFSFRIEIEGVDAGRFTEVSGLSVEEEVVEHRSGSDSTVRKLPGRTKYGDITLKRGLTTGGTLHEWINSSLLDGTDEPSVDRRDGALIILNRAGEPVARYNFFQAWPRKWEVGSLEGKGNSALIEELIIVIESFEEVAM